MKANEELEFLIKILHKIRFQKVKLNIGMKIKNRSAMKANEELEFLKVSKFVEVRFKKKLS